MLAVAHPPDDEAVAALRTSLAARVATLARGEGLHEPAVLPELMLVRSDNLHGTVCGVYQPCVALILQGTKRVMLGQDAFVYGPRRYLISTLDLPAVSTVLEATPQRPYLALVLRLDLHRSSKYLIELCDQSRVGIKAIKTCGTYVRVWLDRDYLC